MANKKDNTKGQPADRSKAKRSTAKLSKGGVVVEAEKTNTTKTENKEA